jgi:hypothetical protein
MHLRRLGCAVAAVVVFAGEPLPNLHVECSCPISVRGGGAAVSYKSDGRARIFTKSGTTWVVVDGAAEGLTVTVPTIVYGSLVVRGRGDIDVRKVRGNVQGETVGGRVFLDGIDGDAVAHTDGGEIKVGKVVGALRAVSAGNGISAGQIGGETWCETTGGEIIIERSGGPIHATTGGGNIYVGDAAMSVTARSDGGLIDVQRAGGVVVAMTLGGSIQVGASPT